MRVLAVTNIYPTPERPALGTFVEQQVKGLRAIGLEVDVLYVDRAGGGMGAYQRVGADALRRARDTHADLVHVMYGGVMADRVLNAVTDRPRVVSFCGSDLLGERLSGFTRRWISAFGVWASHRAARGADGIVVKSRNLYRALPRGLDPAKIRTLPNGVDLERFRPLDRAECRARLGFAADRFHVLFPANTGDPRKRPWIARAAIERLAARGVPAELHELRGVPHDQVPAWINACDAVILTSLAEGSPNIVKEALACDVAVVSVDVGDVAERLEGLAGCFVAEADPEALAQRLAEARAGTGRVRGRERMSELSIQRVAERLRDFYAEVVAAAPRR